MHTKLIHTNEKVMLDIPCHLHTGKHINSLSNRQLDGESFLFYYEEVLPLSINTRQEDAKRHAKMSIKLIMKDKYEY